MNIQTLSLSWDSSVGQDPLFEFSVLQGITVVGLSYCPQSYTGSPTSSNIDIVDDGVDVIAGACVVASAGTPATWKSKSLGGTQDPVAIAGGSVVGVTLNFTGGTAPAALDGTVVIYYLPGVV